MLIWIQENFSLSNNSQLIKDTETNTKERISNFEVCVSLEQHTQHIYGKRTVFNNSFSFCQITTHRNVTVYKCLLVPRHIQTKN